MAFWNPEHFSQLQVRQHKVTITIPDRFRLVSRMPSNLNQSRKRDNSHKPKSDKVNRPRLANTSGERYCSSDAHTHTCHRTKHIVSNHCGVCFLVKAY